MRNFDYHIPTDIYFGKGQITNLGTHIKELGSRVLMVYGGGSIKRTGVYDATCEELKKVGASVWELSGVEPNPRIESVREGARMCREHNIEIVLAVGGGSTIDCAKVIAAGACWDGDPWDLVLDSSKITRALPLVSVLTLAATGSEMDPHAVISDLAKNEKWGTSSEVMRPTFSIMDPTFTYSVSSWHTAAGSSDIMSHIFECYFNQDKGAYVQARMAEALLHTVIHYAPLALKNPEDYDARANLMWASSLAINGLIRYGEGATWSVHPMEHELSAFYDITHGAGLALLTPYWMEYVLNDETEWKFVEYGCNVWHIDSQLPAREIAHESIRRTRAFFDAIGMPSHLHEVEIDDTHFDIMAEKAARGLEQAFVPLSAKDVRAIFESAR